MNTQSARLPSFLLLAALGFAPAPALAAETLSPRHAPVAVNQSGYPATNPAVAMDSQGEVAVVWQDGSAHGSLEDDTALHAKGIGGQFLDASGNLLGGNFVVNAWTKRDQVLPAIAVTHDNLFMAAWSSRVHEGDAYWGIGVGPVTGIPGGARHNFYIDERQHIPDIATSANGHQVVAWQSDHINRYDWDIVASLDGGIEFEVSEGLGASDDSVSVAMSADGHFALVWHRAGDVHMRVYDPSGVPLSGDLVATELISYTQRNPDVAALADGTYLVVWEDNNTPSRAQAIMGRRFATDGTPLGGQFEVSQLSGTQYGPAVAADPNGRATVVWSNTAHIQARMLDPITHTPGQLFELETDTVNNGRPDVAMGAADELVVTWPSSGGDGLLIWVRQFDIVDSE